MGAQCRITGVVFVKACATVLFGLGATLIQFSTKTQLQQCYSCDALKWLYSAQQQGRRYFNWFRFWFLVSVSLFSQFFTVFQTVSKKLKQLMDWNVSLLMLNMVFNVVFFLLSQRILLDTKAFLPHLPPSIGFLRIIDRFYCQARFLLRGWMEQQHCVCLRLLGSRNKSHRIFR